MTEAERSIKAFKIIILGSLILIIFFVIAFAVVVYIWNQNCGLLGCGSSDAVQRVASPNGRYELVLMELNYGATSTYSYDVYVVPLGSVIDPSFLAVTLVGATRSKDAWGLDMKWKSNNQVIVQYLATRDIKNRKMEVDIGNEIIRIDLLEGIENNAAPAGGMLFNLNRNDDQ